MQLLKVICLQNSPFELKTLQLKYNSTGITGVFNFSDSPDWGCGDLFKSVT